MGSLEQLEDLSRRRSRGGGDEVGVEHFGEPGEPVHVDTGPLGHHSDGRRRIGVEDDHRAVGTLGQKRQGI